MVKNTQPILMPLSRRGCLSQLVFHGLIAVFLRDEASRVKVVFVLMRAEQKCDAAQTLPLMGREVRICVWVQTMTFSSVEAHRAMQKAQNTKLPLQSWKPYLDPISMVIFFLTVPWQEIAFPIWPLLWLEKNHSQFLYKMSINQNIKL